MASESNTRRVSTKKSKPGSATTQKTGAEFVNIGSPKENLLETYFVLLSKFSFDRAKELCDNEREVKSGTGGANWCDLMSLLSRLCLAEINYYSLTFMERSPTFRLTRKETLKDTYEMLILDLKKVHEVYFYQKGGTDFSWERKMAELITSILEYIAAKRDMIDFYVHFEISTGSCHIDYKKLEAYNKSMLDRYKDSFQHPFLKPVKITFQKEVTILMDLLQAQTHISEWCFLPAILAIQSADSKLISWNGIVPLGSQRDMEPHPVQKSIRSPPPTPPLSTKTPYLYKWICKFHNALLAKFTLYFHKVLTEHASVYDMKHLSAKLDVDYIASLLSLIRQAPAVAVSLVFDSNGLSDFNGPKYHVPGSPSPLLTGLNSYPFMVSVPHDFEFYHHRANIVSLIMEKSHQLSGSNTQLASQHDDNLHCVYYLTQVEPRVSMIAILSSKRRERDTKVNSLLLEIASQLRNYHITASLRP